MFFFSAAGIINILDTMTDELLGPSTKYNCRLAVVNLHLDI